MRRAPGPADHSDDGTQSNPTIRRPLTGDSRP
jgi:hypothetical protein